MAGFGKLPLFQPGDFLPWSRFLCAASGEIIKKDFALLQSLLDYLDLEFPALVVG